MIRNIPPTIGSTELQLGKYEAPQRIMGDWLQTKGYSVLYAGTGVGKSWLSTYLAFCASTGTRFFNWQPEKRFKVLYVDGENGDYRMHRRYNAITSGYKNGNSPQYIQFVSKDMFPHLGRVPNIGELEDQLIYDEYIKGNQVFRGADLIIFDNLDTCSRLREGNRDTEKDLWYRIKDWVEKWCRVGKSFLFVHHTNKAGEMYGTSKIANNVISKIFLEKVHYATDEGKIIGTAMKFEKDRDATGDLDSQDLFIEWFPVKDETGIKEMTWSHSTLEDLYIKIIQKCGLKKPKEVADTLKISINSAAYFLNLSSQRVLADEYVSDKSFNEEWF